MVQPVSGEQICLKGLKVSACLEMGWGILSDPNNVNRGWRDVRQITCLGFACVMRACVPGVGWSVLVHMLSANTSLRKRGYSKAQLHQFDIAYVLHHLQLWSHITFASSLLLSFCLSLCLFFVKINLRAMLPSQLATQRDSCSLCAHAMMNVQLASLSDGLFSIQWDTKREEAFNTNTTICVTRNCHFPRKWMCWGWDKGGTGMLQSWLGGCWTAVGHGCCLPGEMDSERWGKDLRAMAQQVQSEPGLCFRTLHNVCTAALFMLR